MNDIVECTETDTKKTITILGTGNRYQMKKVTGQKKEPKRRIIIERWGIPIDYFSLECQIEIVDCLYKYKNYERNNCPATSDKYMEYYSILRGQLEDKLTSYKHQDKLKNRLDFDNFITYNCLLDCIHECRLKCHYCLQQTFILYEMSREMRQWTIDRVDNTIGHNKGNIVISCLDCNLKRRSQNKDTFKFSKNLQIVRKSYIEEDN